MSDRQRDLRGTAARRARTSITAGVALRQPTREPTDFGRAESAIVNQPSGVRARGAGCFAPTLAARNGRVRRSPGVGEAYRPAQPSSQEVQP